MELKWHYPEKLEELERLLEKEGVLLHAGGTGIPKSRLHSASDVVDLARLPLRYCRVNDGIVRIGAMETLSGAVGVLSEKLPDHILVKALSRAAATPLRNRITLGGSVAYFPAWSDVMGPLIALDGRVTLVGRNTGDFSVVEYVEDRKLHRGSAVTEVSFSALKYRSCYHREVRVDFDYPAFTLTILARLDEERIDDIRIVFIGNVGRFEEIASLEELLRGERADKVAIKGIGENLELRFPRGKWASPEYLKEMAGVWLERGLEEVLGR